GSDSTQYNRIWIDFNQNGNFEASESFSLGTSAGSNGTAIITFMVPEDAVLGQTRLRVRGGEDSAITAAQACGASSSGFGRAIDYLVNITEAPSCIPPADVTASNATGNSVDIAWVSTGTIFD